MLQLQLQRGSRIIIRAFSTRKSASPHQPTKHQHLKGTDLMNTRYIEFPKKSNQFIAAFLFLGRAAATYRLKKRAGVRQESWQFKSTDERLTPSCPSETAQSSTAEDWLNWAAPRWKHVMAHVWRSKLWGGEKVHSAVSSLNIVLNVFFSFWRWLTKC